MKNKAYAVILLVLAVSLSACSANKSQAPEASFNLADSKYNFAGSADIAAEYDANDMYEEHEYDMVYEAGTQTQSVRNESSYGGIDTGAAVINADKIIMSGNIQLETDDFDSVVNNIRSLVFFYNGYTSSSNLYTSADKNRTKRRYTAVIKIPAGKFGQAFDDIKSIPGLINASQRQENVSAQYTNTESRLATRKIEEERLLSLIDKAVDINDLLSLERRLWEVRTDIEIYEAQLKNIDKLVAYSTVSITVSELGITAKEPSDTLIGRIRDGFYASLSFLLNIAQGFTYIFAASFLPFIILLLLILLILWVIRRVLEKK